MTKREVRQTEKFSKNGQEYNIDKEANRKSLFLRILLAISKIISTFVTKIL
jgi:hypothetical protein